MGHKRKNGHWYVTIILEDTYNFDDWRPIFKNGFSFANTANDLGYVLQKTGLLFEYEIRVSFAMEF